MVLEANCSDYLSELSADLDGDVGFIMSHWQDKNDVSGLANGSDFVGCDSTKYNFFEGFKIKTLGSTEAKENDNDNEGDSGKLIYGEPAHSVDACNNADCTECVEAWYENAPTDTFYECKSETQFRYKK